MRGPESGNLDQFRLHRVLPETVAFHQELLGDRLAWNAFDRGSRCDPAGVHGGATPHVPTVELQNRLLAPPGGYCILAKRSPAATSRWGPLFALAHLRDTMRLVVPGQAARQAPRLALSSSASMKGGSGRSRDPLGRSLPLFSTSREP